MATLSVTNFFIAGTYAKASEVNQNFTDIVTFINGASLNSGNFDILTGTLGWSLTASVNAITVTHESTVASIDLTHSAALIAGQAPIKVINSGSSTLAAASILYGEASSGSATSSMVVLNNSCNADDSASVLFQNAGSDVARVSRAGAFQENKSAAGWTNALVPVGVIMPYAGTTAPSGWLMCNGTAYNTTTYAELYAVIGGTFGSNLPDLCGRTPVGKDDMGGIAAKNRITAAGSGITGTTLGAAGGNEFSQSHTHGPGATAGSLGDHIHHINNLPDRYLVNATPDSGDIARSPYGSRYGLTDNANQVVDSTNLAHVHDIAIWGSGDCQNMPPALVLNYIIKY